MAFKRARREKVWLKIMITGPSGSGKSYSALRLAKGLAEACGSDIAYIGTEGSRNLYYANEFCYDLMELSEDGDRRSFTDFSPESYIHQIDEAVKAGYCVLLLDGISQEWQFLVNLHNSMSGNSFQNWGKVKPRHAAFMEKILTSPIHIICTARGKDAWVIEQNSEGKQIPKKVGIGSDTSKDVSYNMTVSFLLNQENHTYEADKDNTHLFDQVYGKVLTEDDGRALYEWANASEIPATVKEPKFEKAVATEMPELDIPTLQQKCISLAVSRGGQKNKELMDTMKKFVPNGNPNALKSATELNELIAAIEALPEVKTA